MKIGEVARKSGISVRMLRWYEEQGLLSPDRRPSGYREYNNGHLRLLLVLKRLQEASLPVATITELLPCIIEQQMLITQCPMVMDTFKKAKNRLRRTIEQLQLSEASLDKVIETIGSPVSDAERSIMLHNTGSSVRAPKPIRTIPGERVPHLR